MTPVSTERVSHATNVTTGKMSDVKTYVQEKVHQTTESVGLTAKEARDKAQQTLQYAQQQTQATANDSINQLYSLADQVRRNRFVSDAKLVGQIPNLVYSAMSGTGLDDRKMLLEQLITLLASLPVSSGVSKTLSGALISIIWGDLPHPAVSYLGQGNRYRSADGSGNSIANPQLGASNQPYSRNVQRKHPQPVNLPDPGTVFDMLLARDRVEHHPSGISSLLFNFANIIIHDIFSTKHEIQAPSSINQHSSYLDLQVIYGADETEQKKVRTGNLGLLKPDAIGDWRLAIMPPSTAALGILFSRSHNYIAKRLLEVNEGKRFDELQGPALDEELFGMARLVNCGLFLHIVLRDYIPAILNTNDSEWYVDPVEVIHNIGGPGKLSRGEGNSVAVEFSVLYRWHAAVSQADEKWMNSFFEDQWPGRRPEDVSSRDFLEAAARIKEAYKNTDPAEWDLHQWVRDSQGRFDDAVLAKVIKDATVEVAAAFKARGHPSWFRPVEILGIITARKDWALCTMNEFRAFLGLKTYSSFSEWNPDPKVAQAAEMLYGDIDNLELYPGLMAEEAKPSMPGSGLCPGYTISRGILSDAAALTRGDRFYTEDYSTSNMSSYGYEYSLTPQSGSRGLIGKLIMSTLPGQFPYNSIYALYPFRIPSKTISILKERGVLDQYDTAYPAGARRWHAIESYAACKDLLEDSRFFVSLPNMSYDEATMASALQSITRWQDEVADFYSFQTSKLMRDMSLSYSRTGNTRIVDVLEVVNTVSAEFTSTLFGLPTPGTHGLHLGMTPNELHMLLAKPLAYAMYGSFDFLGRQTWGLEEKSEEATRRLKNLLWARIHTMGGLLTPVFNLVQGISNVLGGPGNIAPNEMAKQFYHYLFASGKGSDQLVKDCLHMMVSMTATHSVVMLQALQWFLHDDNAEERAAMHALAQKDDPASVAELRHRVLEAYRVCTDAPAPAKFAVQAVSLTDYSGHKLTVQVGEGVYMSAGSLYRDPLLAGESADQYQPQSKLPVRLGLGDAPTQSILEVALPAIAKQIFKHRGLRMAPTGPPPTVNDDGPVSGENLPFYISNHGAEHPLPIDTSMHIIFESS
ncbi:putative dioxygenase Ssp1 [Testicularia cyperi]|uniref:Putative dioxygenase Ssp1 n=1 Tax=Testicularia cyperi TaxID=1882483 RepID=A0A317XLC4_9BASI|nr:putative dioxygenase Ssp1 [Testicularia cyperi]